MYRRLVEQPHNSRGLATPSAISLTALPNVRMHHKIILRSYASHGTYRACCGGSSGSRRRRRSMRLSAAPGDAELAAPAVDSVVDSILPEESEGELGANDSLDAVLEIAVAGKRLPEANPYTPADAMGVPAQTSTAAGLGSAMALRPGSPQLESLLSAASAGGGAVTMQQLQQLFPFQLDAFQARSVEQLLAGKSVVVCAPTGAGKTAIAEAAAAATLAAGRRVIYTTPLKALSNQKLQEKSARFGSARCGLQTGDTSLNPDADIVVMTTEILRNIMYRTAETAAATGGGSGGATRDERLGDVGLVVLDEVHYLGDPGRGSVWEEAIINCPRHIQLLAMSATVRNPHDLGGWISQVHGECVTIQTSFRPVPLRWVFAHKPPRSTCVLDDLLLPGPVPQPAAAAAAASRSSSAAAARPSLGAAAAVDGSPLDKQQQQQQQQQLGQEEQQQQQMQWRLNPRLRVEEWVEEEIRYQAMREARAAKQQQSFFRGNGGGGLDGYYPSAGGRGGGGGGRGGRVGRGRGTSDRQDLARRVMTHRTPIQESVVRELMRADLLPAIWFILSRRDCDLAAVSLGASSLVLVTPQEEAELEAELLKLFGDNPDAVREKLVPALRRGIASHHAGCLPAWKALVERCFQRGLLKLVFATGTLAAGINMPARTTVISALARRSDEGITLLPHNELLQMAGRAGRRGYDTQGHCVLVQGRFEGAEAAHTIISAGPEPLRSQFSSSYSLVLNLLSVYGLQEARSFLSKSFGTFLQQQEQARVRDEAAALNSAAQQLVDLSLHLEGTSKAIEEDSALVRQCKNEVMRWRTQASAECNEEVRRLLLLDAGAAVMDASSSTPTDNSSSSSSSGECAADISADAFDASNVSDIIEGSSSGYSMPAAAAAGNTSTPVGLPALVMLNLSRHPRDDVVTPVMLPALALRELDSPPLAPSSVRDQPSPPLLLCLGADNRALAVGAQHIVGVCNEPGAVAAALSGGAAAGGGVADSSAAAAAAEELARLDAMLSQAAVEGRMWANLEAGMFSAQVLMLSRAASATVASRLNPPRESFVPVAPSAATAAGLAAAVADLAEAKARLKAARRAEAEAQAAAAAGLGTESSSPAAAAAEQLLAIDSSNGTGSSTAAATAAAALVVAQLKGRDPQLVASRLRKRAKRLLAQVQGGVEETTWSSFMSVFKVLTQLGAMEESTLRLMPLGRLARSINCNNELWMAAALSHPCVAQLTAPQLAAFVGALQCTELLKRPTSIWSSYQVSEPVIAAVEALEPVMEEIYVAQADAGLHRWNEELAVDLRVAGLVEAWAGGASWQAVMADTSIDDGDMARLLARTADMLKQLTFLDEQLPYLTGTARAALRGMDRKPISDLVA